MQARITNEETTKLPEPGCGRTIGHGTICERGSLCDACHDVKTLVEEVERLQKEVDILKRN